MALFTVQFKSWPYSLCSSNHGPIHCAVQIMVLFTVQFKLWPYPLCSFLPCYLPILRPKLWFLFLLLPINLTALIATSRALYY
jgi:hypothetical protein